jgi:Mg/Co/Ni transporter MgtE
MLWTVPVTAIPSDTGPGHVTIPHLSLSNIHLEQQKKLTDDFTECYIHAKQLCVGLVLGFVCVCVCVCVCVYVCVYVCTYVCLYVYVCMYVHMYVCIYVHRYVCIYACI